MTMTSPCRHCARPTTVELTDAVALASYVVLGVLCPACAARQETAREMVEP